MRRPSLRSLAHDAHLPRILVVYVSVSVAVLQTADVLQDRLGLPAWFFPGTLTLLLVGLPLVIATALAQAAHARWSATAKQAQVVVPPVAAEGPGGDVADAAAAEAGRALPPAGAQASRVRLLTWRNAALAGGGAFGLLALSTAGYMGMRVAGIGPAGTLLGKGVLQPRDRVVLADVANHTRDDQLGTVVTEALRTQLEQSASVMVVPAADIRATLVRMQRDSAAVLTQALALELAQRLGAKAVVTSEIGVVGSGYLLSAHVLATDTAAPIVSVLERADGPNRLIAAVDRLSRKLRERMGESLRSIRASAPLEQVTTPSLQALRLYSEANRLMHHSPGEQRRALALLEAAVALDTGFASAYRAMGVALLNQGLQRARGMDMLRRSLDRSERLPPVERLRTRALYDWNRGDLDRAEGGYRALLELNPADGGALNNLGGTLADRGDHARADSCFRAALRLDPASSAPAYNHAMALLALRQHDSARAFLRAHFGTVVDLAALYPATLLRSATEPPESLLAFAGRARLETRDPEAGILAMVVEVGALWTSGRLREAGARQASLVGVLEGQGLRASALDAELTRARIGALLQGGAAAARTVDSALARFPLEAMAAEDRPALALAYTLALVGRSPAADRALQGYRAALRSGTVAPEPAGEKLASGTIALFERRLPDALADLHQAHELPMGPGLPSRQCRACASLLLAQAYDALGARDSAIAVYERFLERPDPDRFWIMPALAPAHERLSELYAAQGDRQQAALHGAAFLRLWQGADPALQPRVAAMRQRLERLGTDRPPQ